MSARVLLIELVLCCPRFIFPGLALGAFLGRTGVVTDMMIQACAEALPELIRDEDLETGFVFPRLSDARPALHPARPKP